MNASQPSVPAHLVCQSVVRSLASSRNAACTVEKVWLKEWSIIYTIVLDAGGSSRRLVVKIIRAPEHLSYLESLSTPDLVDYGKREYECLKEVFEHFSEAPEDLRALEPIGYLPDINGVVTSFATGISVWKGGLRPLSLLSARNIQNAMQMMHQTGRWLRYLHSIQREEPGEGRLSTAQDSLSLLEQHALELGDWGIRLERQPRWLDSIEILRKVRPERKVWLHGDFHPGNLLILPGNELLGFDTALKRFGSPYEDLGKFIAALRSRRIRIFSGVVYPPMKLILRLEAALLEGYHQGDQIDYRSLLLYEGRYLLKKWLEVLQALEGRAYPSLVQWSVERIIHASFAKIFSTWLARVVASSPATSG